MKVEKYLQQIEKLDALLENKRWEKEQWEAIAESTTAGGDGERVQSSGNKDKMATATIEKMSIDEQIAELQAQKDKIIHTLEQLPTDEYKLMHAVYVKGYTLKFFAASQHRGGTWASNLHKRAKESLQAILDEILGGGE